MLLRAVALSSVMVLVAPAWAQYTPGNSAPGDVAIIHQAPHLPGDTCLGTLCLGPTTGIPLSYFARSSDLSGLAADINRSLELAVVAAAIKNAVPDPGDTFAFSLNGASDGTRFAGAVGIGLRLSSNAIVNLNYGQGATTGIASGGVTFSFP